MKLENNSTILTQGDILVKEKDFIEFLGPQDIQSLPSGISGIFLWGKNSFI